MMLITTKIAFLVEKNVRKEKGTSEKCELYCEKKGGGGLKN